MPITAGMVSAASGLKNPAGAVELGYRVNFCANPNFEASTTYWNQNGAGVLLEKTSEEFFSGTSSLKVILGSTSSFIGAVYGTNNRIPVTPGQSYRLSLYVKTGANNSVASYRLRTRTFTDVSGGSIISNPASTAVEIQPGSEWTRLSFAPAYTDPGIAAVTITLDRTTTSASTEDVVYIDNVIFEQSSTLKDYFDGSSPGAFWGGAENASISGITPH